VGLEVGILLGFLEGASDIVEWPLRYLEEPFYVLMTNTTAIFATMIRIRVK
jgi:hypothetical protein